MSPRKVRARLIVSEDTGDVRAVEVFGELLTADFAELEVSEEVFAKLRDNPHIEVQVPKSDVALFDHDGDGRPGGSKPRAKPADQPEG